MNRDQRRAQVFLTACIALLVLSSGFFGVLVARGTHVVATLLTAFVVGAVSTLIQLIYSRALHLLTITFLNQRKEELDKDIEEIKARNLHYVSLLSSSELKKRYGNDEPPKLN